MRRTTAGKLRDRVSFLRESNAADGQGGNSESWVPSAVGTVWGDFTELTGEEKYFAEGKRGGASARIIVRRRTDITKQLRCVVDSTTYSIQSVRDPDGTRTWLELECAEAVV